MAWKFAEARLTEALGAPAVFKVLIDRGSSTRALVLSYGGALERLELPSCESCGRETDRVWASPSARLLCPTCAGDRDGARPSVAMDDQWFAATRSDLPSPFKSPIARE
jgi:hypothetical protein